jgi:hypothetical protein
MCIGNQINKSSNKTIIRFTSNLYLRFLLTFTFNIYLKLLRVTRNLSEVTLEVDIEPVFEAIEEVDLEPVLWNMGQISQLYDLRF